MNNKHDVIIFDLDGTLLDTSPGIYGSVRYAESKMMLKPVDESVLSQFVGPPPKEMYIKVYGLSNSDAIRATEYHREYGARCAVREAKVYDGIIETLSELKKNGYCISVATLKKQNIAEVILENYDLKKYFSVIVGMNEEESFTKADTIEYVLKRTNAKNPVLVGDTHYDYTGAKEKDIDFVGVTYGFGFVKGKEYPFRAIDSPQELLAII